MADTINVNGTPVVFNNVLCSVDGDTAFPINEYLTGVTYTTAAQADHVVTINQAAEPIMTNQIVNRPSGTLSFAPMMSDAFYTFLNDRSSTFTLQLIQYVTGNIGGAKKTLLIENARINENTMSVKPSSPQNDSTVSIISTSAKYI